MYVKGAQSITKLTEGLTQERPVSLFLLGPHVAVDNSIKFISRAICNNTVSPFNNQTLRFKSGAIAVKNRLPFQGQTTPDGNSLLLSLFLWPGRL